MPAHDEANVIGTALRGILDAREGDLEVIVVANGCTDLTAERARAAGSRVRVIEIAEASKISALNAGSREVESYPVAFVDADVDRFGARIWWRSRRDSWTVALGSPRRRCVLARRPHGGCASTTGSGSSPTTGPKATSARACTCSPRRVASASSDFPTVIADDLFVQRLFAPSERHTPDHLTFSVDAPRSLRALTRRNTRIAAGNRQLAQVYPESGSGRRRRPGHARSFAVCARRPSLWIGFVVYASVYLTAHRRAASTCSRSSATIAWSRDTTTRASPFMTHRTSLRRRLAASS